MTGWTNNFAVWKKLLIAAAAIFVIYFGITFVIASYVVSPTARHIDISPDFISADYQNVSFKTSDNLELKGWLFKPSSVKFVIFVPGILDNRTNQGYYGADLARELINQGFGVLMYDPRARGDSEGKTRLKNEKEDIVAAVSFLVSKNISSKNIDIIAYSTGARATLLALPDIKNIGGVVLDSTPTDFKAVIDYVVKVEEHIPGITLPGVYFWLNFYGIDLGPEKVLNNLSRSPDLPLLILHAQHDSSVPIQNSQELFAKANSKISRFVVFPKGSHIETYKFNPDMYRKVVFDFLKGVKK